MSAHGLLRVMLEFQKVCPGMPVSMAATFLAIAHLDEPTSGEIARHVGLTRSAAGRYTQDLGSGERPRAGPATSEGLGLVEGRIDPLDARYKRFRLTQKGRDLFDLLRREVRP